MASFAEQMRKLTEKTKRSLNDTVVEVVTELALTITFRTPIGDPTLWQNPPPPDYVPGTLINSWNSLIGSPSGAVVRKPDAFAKDTFAQIQAVAPQAPGNEFFFMNPTPWAFANEFGHSSQAPQGMVRLTVRNFSTIVSRVAAKHR